MPRIGLFGGSFDPPHVGHLLAAVDAREALGLDRVLWIPAATQPLKAGQGPGTPAAHRVAMVRRTVRDTDGHLVDTIEVDRGGLSFMIDTVRALAARDRQAEWVLLLGADAAARLPEWREPAALLALVDLVVLTRATSGPEALPAGARALATRRCDVSSTEIRRRVATGRSIRGFVTDGVADYIAEQGLYREAR